MSTVFDSVSYIVFKTVVVLRIRASVLMTLELETEIAMQRGAKDRMSHDIHIEDSQKGWKQIAKKISRAQTPDTK